MKLKRMFLVQPAFGDSRKSGENRRISPKVESVKSFETYSGLKILIHSQFQQNINIYFLVSNKLFNRSIPSNLHDYSDTFNSAIAPILLIAQCFGIMPLQNVYSDNPAKIKFTWMSFRFFYSLFISFFLFVQVVLVIAWTFSTKIEFGKIVPLMMYTTNFSGVFYFFKLGFQWPELMRKWYAVETKLPIISAQLKKPKLGFQIKMIASITLSITLSK